MVTHRRVRVTARSWRESVSGNRDVTSVLRWQHPFRIEDPNWHRSKQLHRECEWKQGDSARERKIFLRNTEGGRTLRRLPLVGGHLFRWHDQKVKIFPGGKRLKDVAPPVGRRSPFSVARPKLVLDSGGLLMEAMMSRQRCLEASVKWSGGALEPPGIWYRTAGDPVMKGNLLTA